MVRVRGTKNPDLEAIGMLVPDLVAANAEENWAVDITILRARGIRRWVTDIRTVDQALVAIGRPLYAVGVTEAVWLNQARSTWAQTPTVAPRRRVRAVVPIWRRPWMFVGADIYAGDVLRRLGVDNVLSDSVERYPKLPLGWTLRGKSFGSTFRAITRAIIPGHPGEVTAAHGRSKEWDARHRRDKAAGQRRSDLRMCGGQGRGRTADLPILGRRLRTCLGLDLPVPAPRGHRGPTTPEGAQEAFGCHPSSSSRSPGALTAPDNAT